MLKTGTNLVLFYFPMNITHNLAKYAKQRKAMLKNVNEHFMSCTLKLVIDLGVQ